MVAPNWTSFQSTISSASSRPVHASRSECCRPPYCPEHTDEKTWSYWGRSSGERDLELVPPRSNSGCLTQASTMNSTTASLFPRALVPLLSASMVRSTPKDRAPTFSGAAKQHQHQCQCSPQHSHARRQSFPLPLSGGTRAATQPARGGITVLDSSIAPHGQFTAGESSSSRSFSNWVAIAWAT